MTTDVLQKYKNFDTVWVLLTCLCPTLSSQVPTWAAYNSLIGKENALTSFCCLPIIHGSPTDWGNLYSAIKEAEHLNEEIAPGTKTVISFDLQLYSKAIQLQSKPDVNERFVFRIGELHVVFTVLKILGKLIDGSGLDQAFEEAGTTCLEVFSFILLQLIDIITGLFYFYCS